MKPILLGAASLNLTPMAWEENFAWTLAAISTARNHQVGILTLPELSICGYGCEDMFFSNHLQQTSLEMLAKIIPHTGGMVVAVGLPIFSEGVLYNAMAMLADGKLLGFVCKQFLADDGIHYEPRWFKPWPAGKVTSFLFQGQEIPVGDLLFECGGVKIGFEICRDAWVSERRPIAGLACRGADVILNPSGSHFAFNKHAIRLAFATTGTAAHHVSFAFCNLLGNESGRTIFDGGELITSGGKMLTQGPRLTYANVQLSFAEINVQTTRQARRQAQPAAGLDASLASGNHAASDEVASAGLVSAGLVSSELVYPDLASSEHARSEPAASEHDAAHENQLPLAPAELCLTLTDASTPLAAWEKSDFHKEEEFTRTIALGLFDYLRKSRSHGFVISLSGGADSAAVAVLVTMMVRFGVQDLGQTGFLKRLSYIPAISDLLKASSTTNAEPTEVFVKEIVGRLLTCVYQATENSSRTTLQAAQTVAQTLGADFLTWNIDLFVEGYTKTVSEALGRVLTWEQEDAALQNIQARSRGPGVWMVANLRNALLLATSNRSEAAVGYATMDGDTCGGLSPVGGIDKAWLCTWLVWIEKHGPAGIGPIPELAVVNAQSPTAELRPVDMHQTDEADLMPYDILNTIEGAAIRDRLSPVEVYRMLKTEYQEVASERLGAWVTRFFQLWCRNQWKRERYAPAFHVDDKNLDPKSWCRFPALSGGFQRELAALEQLLAKENSD